MSQNLKRRLGTRIWSCVLFLALGGICAACLAGVRAGDAAGHGGPASPAYIDVRIIQFDPSDDTETISAGAHVWAFCVMKRGVNDNPFVLSLGEMRSDERGQAHFDLTPLAALPDLDRELCSIRIWAHQDGCDANLIGVRLHELAERQEPEVLELSPGNEQIGRVRNAQGEPVAWAEAYFEEWDTSAAAWQELDWDACDEMGYFTWQLAGESRRRVVAEHGDWGAAILELPTEAGLLELVLAPVVPVIAGRVISADGQPLPGRGMAGATESGRFVHFVTDERGEFRYLPRSAGQWSLELDIEVRRDPAPEPVLALPGSDALVIRDGGTFLLVKTLDAQGRPLNSLPPEAFRVREQRTRVSSNLKDLRLSSSGLFPVDHSHYAQRVSDGLWLIELAGAGEYFVELAASLPRECVGSLTRFVVEAGEVKHVTMIAQRIAKAPPLELEVLDVNGAPVENWQAVLLDARTGRFVESFGPAGVAVVYCLGGPTYRDPVFPPGEYELYVWPEEGSSMLPARGTLLLQPSPTAPTQVRFPGNGGFVHVLAGDVVARSGERGLRVVFHSVQANATKEELASQRLSLLRKTQPDDDPVVLLAPGEWRWQLLTPAGQELDAGQCTVQAMTDIRLVL